MNSRFVSTSGCITRCSEREVTLLCHLVRNFLKMSKQLTPDSFDTELFITEMEQLPAMWDSRSSDRNNQEQTYVWETLCKNLLKIPVSLITNFSATMQACELPPLHPLHLLTMVGRVAANSSAARVTAIVRSAAVAPLNTARGKGPLHAGNRIAVIFVRRQIIYGYYFWRQDCRMCITTLIFQATATLEVSSIWNFWECCQHSYSMWR